VVSVGYSCTLALSKLFRLALNELLILLKLNLCLSNSPLRHTGMWGSGCIAPRILDLGNSSR
jgi:hypothetical protein